MLAQYLLMIDNQKNSLPEEGMSTQGMRALLCKIMDCALEDDILERVPKLVPLLIQCAKLIRDTVEFNNKLGGGGKGENCDQMQYDSEKMNSNEERERVARKILSRIIARHNAEIPEDSPKRIEPIVAL